MIESSWAQPPSALRDEPVERVVTYQETLARGGVWDVRRDTVDLGDGQSVVREVLVHPGAVGVIVVDEEDRLLLIRQYRHPVAMYMWEPVAGLIDTLEEDPLDAAQRELVEEAGLVAARWDVLIDYEPSPGGSTEAIRVYRAQGLTPAPGGRPVGAGEERDLPTTWVTIDEALAAVFSGRFTAPITVIGVLALALLRERAGPRLRDGSDPWPTRDHLLATGRIRSTR